MRPDGCRVVSQTSRIRNEWQIGGEFLVCTVWYAIYNCQKPSLHTLWCNDLTIHIFDSWTTFHPIFVLPSSSWVKKSLKVYFDKTANEINNSLFQWESIYALASWFVYCVICDLYLWCLWAFFAPWRISLTKHGILELIFLIIGIFLHLYIVVLWLSSCFKLLGF